MRKHLAFALAGGFVLALAFAVAPVAGFAQDQNAAPNDNMPAPKENPNPPGPKGNKAESYRQFDHFLRTNPEAAEQIKKNPQLLNNPEFLSKHPGLQKYMSTHPDMAQDAKNDPGKLMQQTHEAAKRHAEYKKEHEHRPEPATKER